MYLCMHNVQENERKNTISKITVMGFEPSTFPCKKTPWLLMVRSTLPMPPPVLPLCLLIANYYKLVYINYVTQISYS